jgi:multicomponent Na+:H+ antiporter subunit G
VIVEAVMLVGAVLVLLAAVGVVRFDDTLTRMHALTKATTLGLLLVLIPSAFALDHANDWTSVGLAALLQVLTTPVSAQLIGRATYRSGGLDHRLDDIDELAEADGRAPLERPRPAVGPDPA